MQGVYVGRASIRRGLGRAGLAEGEINDHINLQTIVTVLPDARTARTRGTEIGMMGTTGGRALWSQSIYENEFVKQGGVWKFKTMHVYPRFIVDAEKGWAKDAQSAPGPSRDFPADRPPTETYEIYPRFHIAPFHFDHPVTGRPPQYPEGTTRFAPAGGADKPAADGREDCPALASLLAATERSGGAQQAPTTRQKTSPRPTATTSTSSRGTRPRTSSRATAGRNSLTSAPTSAGSESGSR